MIKRIAEHPDIQGVTLLQHSQSLTSQSQFLYQKYKNTLEARGEFTGDEIVDDRKSALGWIGIVHDCLYQGASVDDQALRNHQYLWDLIPLIKEASMTVNYNFDDSIERMIYLYNQDVQGGVDEKGFEVVWQPSTQFRRNKGVIYHPNGFLPKIESDGFSSKIVFMEQEFADQLIDVGVGHYSCLLNHFSKNTLLFLGLSLSDTTLKHLLRVAAKSNPGSFHYHIDWCREAKPSEDEQNAIRRANFSVYNLFTVFMTTDEIRDLVGYVLMDEEKFAAVCDDEPTGIKTVYRYYVTGPVGAGKSTVLSQMRCIETFDEWVDRKNSLLLKPHEKLTNEERHEVDSWINGQFRKKNRRVTKAYQGIHIVDRSPLDPIYFVQDDEAKVVRARELMDALVPRDGEIKAIAPGHVFVLDCDVAVLKTRLASRKKDYTKEQIVEQQHRINDFWRGKPVTRIDTTNLVASQVVARIMATIMFNDYQEINLHEMCQHIIGQ